MCSLNCQNAACPINCDLPFFDFTSQEFDHDDLESSDLKPLLDSLRIYKGQYVHQQQAVDFLYESLRRRLNYSLKVG